MPSGKHSAGQSEAVCLRVCVWTVHVMSTVQQRQCVIILQYFTAPRKLLLGTQGRYTVADHFTPVQLLIDTNV